MALDPKISSAAQKTLNLPTGLKAYSPFPFAGMNLQASGLAIGDQEFLLLENFVKLGDGNLRTVWDVGTALYTTSDPVAKTIVSHFFYTIGSTYYAVVFLKDGSAIQINTSSGIATTIGGAGTFYNSANGQLPACSQWGTRYLLIANRNTTNDYWIWDGSLLYKAGTAAPNGATLTSSGSAYTSTPTVTVFGGSGTGLAITPKVNGGSVVELDITNPGSGYQIGDVVQVAFSGGGSDTSPRLTANLFSGGVASVTITNAGSGYSSPTVAFSGGGGTGAAATAVAATGVASIAVTAGGSGYVAPTVSFSGGGGSGATATAFQVSGVIVAIVVSNAGSGYTSAPTVAIADVGPGTGATATATIQNGFISSITVTAPGSGYTSAPTVAISGAGTGATATAQLSSGSVQSVTVVDGGTGFVTQPTISFKGGGGSGATGIALLTPTSVSRIDVTAGGSGYTVVPTVKIIADSFGGTGATATATVADGQIVAITVTNGGSGYRTQPLIQITATDGGSGAGATVYLTSTSINGVQISSSGRFYTSAPAVVVAPGANRAAYATVDLMPYGISGAAMETFQSRVFLLNPAQPSYSALSTAGNMLVSAPESLIDFATSDGGLSFTNSDSFLQTRFTGILQSNGYLYVFGDGSVSVISNLQTSGSPATTTFNYQNVDPQAGLSWRDTMQNFGRSIIFGNESGFYGLYGGSVVKVSNNLNELFGGEVNPNLPQAIFPPTAGAVTPSGAVATIFDVKHYLSLLTVDDQVTGAARNVMVTWNEREWSFTTQTVSLSYISTQKVESRFFAWGTDGTSLYPLFQTPSASLTKRLWTKDYGADSMYLIKDLMAVWMQTQDRSTNNDGVSFDGTLIVSGLAAQGFRDPSVQELSLAMSDALVALPAVSGSGAVWPYWPLIGAGTNGVPFVAVSARFTSNSPDFTIGHLAFGYVPMTAVF